MFGPSFVEKYLVSFLVLQSSHFERFTLIAYCLLMSSDYLVHCVSPRGAMGWPQRVLIAFPSHTYSLLGDNLLSIVLQYKE